MEVFPSKENAYFSLEACLILPLVFYMLLFLIYAGFYQYDRCLLRQDTYRLLIRGSQVSFAGNEEVLKKLKEEDTNWCYDKYALCSLGNRELEVKHGSIRITQKAVVKVPFLVLGEWLGKAEWEFSIDAEGGRRRPTQVIRNCRKLERGMERGKRDV